MRLVHFAGFTGCGKTGVIRRICEGRKADFIANNEHSADMLKCVCEHVDFFPFKSPCARIRQYSFRVDKMKEHSPEIVLTESPGNCMEVSAPMLNQIYVYNKEIDLGPLITVIDGRKIAPGISKRDSEGLRIFNMIDESDVIVISFSDVLSVADRESISRIITEINTDAKFFFSDQGSDLSGLADIVFGDAEYYRPLYN